MEKEETYKEEVQMSKVKISTDSPNPVAREIYEMLKTGGKLVNNRGLIRQLKLGPTIDFEDSQWTAIQALVKAGKVAYKAPALEATGETTPTPVTEYKQGDLGKPK